jgi:hypothetical protein
VRLLADMATATGVRLAAAMNRTWPLVTYETMAWACVWLKLIMCGQQGAEPDFSTQKRGAIGLRPALHARAIALYATRATRAMLSGIMGSTSSLQRATRGVPRRHVDR